MSYRVTIVDTAEEYTCRDTQHLLAGMQQLGKKGIPVGCRSGGCGVCKIHILSGEYHAKKMSREHVSEQDETAGMVLACRVYPDSDIELRVLGKMEKAVTGKKRKIP